MSELRARVVYLIAPLVAAIAVASWHSPGRFVAAGDIGPFLREGLAQDVGAVWGYGLTGAGSATGEIARLPELAVARVADWAGLAPEIGQLLFFWGWLAGASAAAIYLARQLVPSALAPAVVGVLAIANPLMAVNLPNPLVPAALCALGLIGAELLRVARGSGSVRRTVLATLPVSYLAINPPTLLVVTLAAAAAVAATLLFQPARSSVAGHLLVAAPVVLVVHTWWLVPTFLVVTGGGAEVEAVTDPEVWSWTHVNNSLANVTTLTAHWGWGIHEYLPFSADLDRLPISAGRWALPVLVGAAPFVAATRARRRAAVVAVAVATTSIVIGKGLHDPAGWLNLELYLRIPGMWLLREPMSKIGPVLLLAYLAAAAIAVDGVMQRVRVSERWRASAASASLALLVAAALVFGHPVLTGAVAPVDRTPLPSSRVEVPDGWYELGAAVNADPAPGKALVLPSLPYYQATTTWGYHGAATLPRDLLRRPTLLGLPGGYFGDGAVVAGLVDVTSGAPSPAQLSRALDALGVSHLIVRTDLADAQAVRPIANPDALLSRLNRSGVFERPVDYGVATLFRRTLDHGGAQVFSDAARIAAASPDGLARAVATVPPGTAAVTEDVGVDVSATVFDGDAGRIQTTIRVPASQRYRLEAAPHDAVTGFASRTATGARIDSQLALHVDGRAVATSEPIDLASGERRAVAVAVDGTPVVLGDQAVPIDLTTGSRIQLLAENSPSRAITEWSPVTDCNAVDDHHPALSATIRDGVIDLAASDHTACVAARLPSPGPALLRFEAKIIRGRTARACLWSAATSRCLWERTLNRGHDDTGWQQVTDVVEATDDAQLFLYADATSAPAAVRYRAVEIVSVAAGPAVAAPVPLPTVDVELAGGKHVLELKQPPNAHLGARVGSPSSVSNCNARAPHAFVSATFHGDVARLEATHDAACVYYPVRHLVSNVTYDISFEYRSPTAAGGRWCLWLDGPDRCANASALLEPTDTWTSSAERIVLPDGVTAARLFVYSDGEPGRASTPTVNEYRRPVVRAATPMTISISDDGPGSTGTAPTAATLRSAHGSGDRRHFAVHGTGQIFLLALPDRADRYWALDGLPEGARASATVIDGYRQAWAISGLEGRAELTAHYAPAHQAAVARLASVAGLAALLTPWRRLRSRHRGERATRDHR